MSSAYKMSNEYKIQFQLPEKYDPAALFKSLPSPIERTSMTEIYNYKIERDGFYFINRLVNEKVAAIALKLFIDEALKLNGQVQMSKL